MSHAPDAARSVSDDTNDTAWNTGVRELFLKRTAFIRSIRPQDVICFGIFGLQLYAALYLAIGKTFLPGGNVWALIVVWAAAHFGGFLVSMVGLHPLLGQLLSGVVLVNIHQHWLLGGLKPSWSAEIRAGALALIFLRSGLELDWEVFKKVGKTAVRLLLIPGICEAIMAGVVTHYIFDMPWLLAFTLGFILKAVGPAIVIQLMFDLQKKGRGIDKGIPALVVAAASFDDLVAITFYTIFASLAITGGRGNVGWQIAEGPLQLVFGVCGGLLGALLASWTKVFDTRWKRAAIVFFTALLLMYFLNHFNMKGGGALAALILGMAVSQFWAQGKPLRLSKRADPHYAHDAEMFVGTFWRLIAQPLLFGLAGAGINFHTTPGGVIPKAILVIISGWILRMPITFFVMAGAGLSLKERLFVTAAWSPKATVQAALASAPAALIAAAHKPAPYPQWGQDIFVTAIFAILICASLGVIAVNILAPRCLKKTAVKWDANVEHRKSREAPGYKSVNNLGDDTGPPSGAMGVNQPPARKDRGVKGLFTADPSAKGVPAQDQANEDPVPVSPWAAHDGQSQTQAPSHSKEAAERDEYEGAVLREQDAAVADHIQQIEKLAKTIRDPVAAEQLREQAVSLRRRKVQELQAGNDDESARAFFEAHKRTQVKAADDPAGAQHLELPPRASATNHIV